MVVVELVPDLEPLAKAILVVLTALDWVVAVVAQEHPAPPPVVMVLREQQQVLAAPERRQASLEQQ